MIGKTLRQYRVTEKIGQGGMGVVYRATDTKLNRDVAIKVLPEDFADSPQRRARFEREAQLLATLNHPNIAAIYGLEQEDGVDYLVLEYVPGETLAEKLAGGRLAVEEAIELALQIADALDAAHESGVIHRDLKPANIKITADGQIKILDFGLAKAFVEDPSGENLSDSPTLSAMATREGVILGTAAYMSPEQARGRPIDKRTDIFAFGTVLYEMLTGQRAFRGEDVSETLAAVIRAEVDWDELPRDVDARIRRVIEGCLRKDRKERRRDIGDVRVDLQEALSAPEAARPMHPAPARRPVFLWVTAAALVGALLTTTLRRTTPPETANPRTRFQIIVPADQSLARSSRSSLALSPDGTRLAYVAGAGIYFRAMDQLEAVAVRGTEGGHTPFFSPDGEWLGFWSDGKLQKVSVAGGAPVSLCDAERPTGATWDADGRITFGQSFQSISRVSENGGTPEVLVKLDETKQEIAYRPQILPGGTAILYTFATAARPNWDEARIVAHSLESGEQRTIVERGFSARYLQTGQLVFGQEDKVMVAAFDPRRLELDGDAFPVAEGVRPLSNFLFQDQLDVSESGTLAYIPWAATPSYKLVWVDREGRATPMSSKPGDYSRPRFSPDGRKIALVIGDLLGGESDIWIYEIERDTFSRLTTSGGDEMHPRWSSDGGWVVFSSERDGGRNIYKRRADFSAPAGRVLEKAGVQVPQSWSPDGRHLLFAENAPGTDYDLWTVALQGQEEPQLFVQTPATDYIASFSPDGSFVAYHSTVSGRPEVYVQPFPGPGRRWQISTDGGWGPTWSRDGRQLFYVDDDDRFMAVEIRTEPDFDVGTPYVWFDGPFITRDGPDFDIAPDGERFVMLFRDDGEDALAGREIHGVLNWLSE